MSMSNATENATLKMHLQGIDPSYRAGATQYLAACTGATIDEADPLANECDFDGYARVALTKATAWTDNGSNFENAALIQFAKRTDAGATQTVRWGVVVDTASGAVSQAIIGQLGVDMPVNQNTQLQFAAGDIVISAE